MAVGRMRTETLTTALARLLTRELMPDLRERSRQPAIEAELTDQHRQEREAKKTGASFIEWREQLLDQVGAAWVLSCVFVRTLEDRGLLDRRRLAGPEGADSQELFFQLAPHLGHRDYLLTVFGEISRLPGAADLLGRKHNAAWRLGISQSAAKGLVEFFCKPEEDGGLRWTFGSEDSRFLGDLYQELSEAVRDRYALLQTPEFVEEFILDRTLEPAIEEFGLETVKVLDPTCGSGHFLLGAFRRLFGKRMAAAPGQRVEKAALAALGQVCGIDLNPYAVAIARFRLTLEFLRVVGAKRLRDAPRELGVGLAVADSLLVEGGRAGKTSRGVARHMGELFPEAGFGEEFSIFGLEETQRAAELLRQSFHVVVGNPPYITCKDSVLRDRYKERYTACYREYSLAAPFCERFFELAVEGGWTGQITANSFMKREFGAKLIEEVLPHLDLSEVIDTSGAYIPGHGTPTVILIGRNRLPALDSVFAIQGKRGEPSTPVAGTEGLAKVWSGILAAVAKGAAGGYEDEFVSSARLARKVLGVHPWSLGGGGASELKVRIEQGVQATLGSIIAELGRTTHTGEDNVFIVPPDFARRTAGRDRHVELVKGEDVRDWSLSPTESCLFPYAKSSLEPMPPEVQSEFAHYWTFRTVLRKRQDFGQTVEERGMKWFEQSMFFPNRFRVPLGITFAEVATHNHFVLDRGGKVFKQTAPVIKLPPNATEDDHLALLGLLNSSVACFWMKQVCHAKSNASQNHHPDPSRAAYQFAGTPLQRFPVPPGLGDSRLPELARRLDSKATQRNNALRPEFILDGSAAGGCASDLESAMVERWMFTDRVREEMVALQEAIDWETYRLFGLISDPGLVDTPELTAFCPRGHRPFERQQGHRAGVRRAGRTMSSDEATVQTGRTLPASLEPLWARRMHEIENNPELKLIEDPVFKRQWRDTEHNTPELEYRAAKDQGELGTYLLTTLENHLKTSTSTPTSVRDAALLLQLNPQVQAVAEVLTSTPDYDLASLLTTLALTDAVPHLAALRYTDAGLEKHAAWQATWALQRREDAGEALDIPVPPKYASTDFRQATYWQLRGKLDVPKERFVLYPGAERDDDPTPVLLWAGADHLQRALALAALYHDRQTNEGWPAEKLLPLLAGLDELVPWLQQWHDDPDPARGGRRMGQYFARFVEEEARKQGAAPADLRAWRPEARRAAKGRKGKG